MELITPEYRAEQEALHEKADYGTMGRHFGPLVGQIIDTLEIDHLLDYGCGRNRSLTQSLRPKRKFKYQAYDPGVPEFSDAPIPAELVTCIDVLEHIEPHLIENVLDHLQEMTQVILFATVTSKAAKKTLSDGRNAHLIQQPMEWWLPRLWDRFKLQTVQLFAPDQFYVIAQNEDLDLADNSGQRTVGSILAGPGDNHH